MYTSSSCTLKGVDVPVVVPAEIVIVAPLSSVIIKSDKGGLLTVAVITASVVPSRVFRSPKVTTPLYGSAAESGSKGLLSVLFAPSTPIRFPSGSLNSSPVPLASAP